MLAELHASIDALLHERGAIPRTDVDIRFDTPKREWIASLVRPTISFFLFDLRENTDLRQTNLTNTRHNGTATFRMPVRRFDVRYMVSVLSSVVEDEHLLLDRVLLTLLQHPTFPTDLLPSALRELDPPIAAQVGRAEEPTLFLDLWKGVDAPPRPSLLYVLTAPLDAATPFHTPVVLSRGSQYRRLDTNEPLSTRLQIGGALRRRSGEVLAGAAVEVQDSGAPGVLANERGEFTIRGVPRGALTLRVTPPDGTPLLVKVEAPLDRYEVIVD